VLHLRGVINRSAVKRSLTKLVRWFIPTVLIAIVLPLGIASIALLTYGRHLNLAALSEHGELLIIAAVIGATAIGELADSRTHRWKTGKIACICATATLAGLSAGWFGIVISATVRIESDVVSFGSLGLLICTVLSSAGCVLLSEV
jgi:hypothetical protein